MTLVEGQGGPDLSVVVVTFEGRRSLVLCLQALEGQEVSAGARIERIVPADDTLGDLAELRSRFPDVRFLPVSGHRTYAELRARGVAAARAPVVAITEDHCLPQPDWCARILQAHTAPHAAVGGAVEKDTRPFRGAISSLSWAVYLADYSRYMRPLPAGPSEYLTDCNVSYKRSAIEPLRATWADELHETTVNWALRDRGESLWFDPSIVVWQHRNLTLSAILADRYAFGRLFATTRVAAVPLIRRVAYAALAPALPAILVARAGRTVAARGKARLPFVRALPLLALLTGVWAWGELLGYVTGRAGISLSPRASHPGPSRPRADS